MLMDKIIGVFSKDIAIDLGTANTIVLVKGEGIVINEPSVVAIEDDRRGSGRILAVGREAKEMEGKTPDKIRAIRPMKDGVIADFDMTEKMIRYFIEEAHKRKSLIRPRIMVCVPYGLTGVEKKAVKESALSAGAREVYLIEEPMAAAIGAGLQTEEAKGNLVIDIGGGTTEIGVVSYGGLVISKSIKVAGDKFDVAIMEYVRKKYNLLIGERTAEEIKFQIGSASPLENPPTIQVRGRDNVSGLLNTVELSSEDAREAMKDQLKEIANALKSVLEALPPDLSGDIIENGIVLTGGGALIRGLDKYLSDIVRLPVYVAEEPLLCVAKGTGKAMEDPKLLEELAID
ncbi:rod shape-determining protein [Helicobacter sp. MIT 00-7814]|uniref:rod shape-determining protein n=1 Tax=unclassified Helicobacter TaxID=2593540 RepID=UPI000E1E908E|nr:MULTISPECIES: rod shape-determining protein [unclassified Helicobacter]RDU54822.1 rod shape-determining protein [Helicobacter sp. MIT 99-10781]RDU54880.1 rod shape-determining protein [Helicobacter sp. MIT 00-7814]